MMHQLSRNLAQISIGLTALAFGGFGAVLLVHPALLETVGVEITRPAGAVELRGFYGGLELGLAVFFAASLGRRSWRVPALAVQILTLGGAAVGRLIGLAVGGGGESLILGLLAAETAGMAVGVLALWRVRADRGA